MHTSGQRCPQVDIIPTIDDVRPNQTSTLGFVPLSDRLGGRTSRHTSGQKRRITQCYTVISEVGADHNINALSRRPRFGKQLFEEKRKFRRRPLGGGIETPGEPGDFG